MNRFRGRVVFSGAVWYHPDYRRQGLTSILPRLTKAYALTKWYTDSIVSFMAEDVVKGGTAERAGYAHVEWDVVMKNSMLGDLRLAFIWSSAARADALLHEVSRRGQCGGRSDCL